MSKSLSDCAKIEIQLGTYVEIALVVTDEETLTYFKRRIADLEQGLRMEFPPQEPLLLRHVKCRGSSEDITSRGRWSVGESANVIS
jgi:hypothetical protein